MATNRIEDLVVQALSNLERIEKRLNDLLSDKGGEPNDRDVAESTDLG